jgi:hypothetical protein
MLNLVVREFAGGLQKVTTGLNLNYVCVCVCVGEGGGINFMWFRVRSGWWVLFTW